MFVKKEVQNLFPHWFPDVWKPQVGEERAIGLLYSVDIFKQSFKKADVLLLNVAYVLYVQNKYLSRIPYIRERLLVWKAFPFISHFSTTPY